jgi:hypothetical protein
MVLRKKKSQRLAISTGADKETGAKSSYARKLRNKEAEAVVKSKSTEERRLEAEIFGLDYSPESDDNDNEGDTGNAGDVSLDWLGQQRSKKLKRDADVAESDDEPMDHLADHEVGQSYVCTMI